MYRATITFLLTLLAAGAVSSRATYAIDTGAYRPHPHAFRSKRRKFKPSRFSHRGPKAQRRRV